MSYCKLDGLVKVNFVLIGVDKIVSFSQICSSSSPFDLSKEVTQVNLSLLFG